MAAVLALGGLGLAQTDAGRDALADIGIATPSEPYTEVALARPDATPRIEDGIVPLAVRVHNVEGARRTYEWTATVHGVNAIPQEATRGRLTLDEGASETLRVRVPVVCTGERVRVDVSIGGPHRAVGAWVPCGEGAS